MEVFDNAKIIIHDLDRSVDAETSIQLYSLDRYDSLLFKVAEVVGAMPADIYCTIRQETAVYFLQQYFVDGKEVALEPAAEIRNLSKRDDYVMFSKIPIHKELLESTNDPNAVNKFKPNKKFLGEFLDPKKPVVLDLLIVTKLGRGINIEDMLKDSEMQKILKVGFLDKYFPFRGFVKSDYWQWVKIENKLQTEKTNFYKEEQKLFKQYIGVMGHLSGWETKYFIRYIDYTLSFWGLKFDLKNMFNHLLLRGNPPIENLGYYFSRNGQWFVAFKSLHPAMKLPEKSLGLELIEGDSGYIRFKISEQGQMTLRLQIGKLFDDYPPPQFFEEKQIEIQTFLDRINKIYYKFSNKKLKKGTAQSQISVRYTSFTTCQLPQIKGYFDYFIRFLQKYETVFTFDKSADVFVTQLMSHGDQAVKFNLDGDVFQMEYGGEVNPYGKFFVQLLLVLMVGQNVQAQQASGQQTMLLSKRLLKNDPVLFGNIVDNIYSRVCQGLRQPEFVGPDRKDEPYVYKFWNFTTNQPQYYKCNKEYQFLSFKVGQHKNNLCIPCCSNTDPQATKKRKQIYDQCMQQRTAVKPPTDSKYIFRNINKFMVDRFTAINQEFEQYIGKDMYIYCITLPVEKTQSIDTVLSIVKSIAYLLDMDIDQFLQEFEHFYRGGVEGEDFVSQLINLRQKSLFQEYDIFQWKLNLQQFLGKQFNLNLFMLDTKNNSHQINYIDTHHLNDVLIRQTGTVYNPVVQIKGSDLVKLLQSDRSISSVTRKTNKDQLNNDMERVRFILDTDRTVIPVAQLLNQKGLCKYVVCKLKSARYVFLPVEASVPLSDVPSARAVDPAIVQNYGQMAEILQLASAYAGEIEYLIEFDSLIRAFVKKTLIFYIQPTSIDALPKQLQSVSVLKKSFDPLSVNITIFNKQNFNAAAYAEAMKSIYQTHIYELIQICALEQLNVSQGSSSLSIGQLKNLKPEKIARKTDWKELTQKILRKLESIQGNKQLDEMGTLYTCKKNPNQFFCDGEKLMVTEDLQYLVDLLREQVEEKSFDINEFTRGLFIMIGKFQFKQGPGEFLQVKQLSSRGQ